MNTSHVAAAVDDWPYASALGLRAAIVAGQISPVEVVTRALERVETLEPSLNSFVTVTAEEAIESARKAERALTSGRAPGPLHGLPISVKDLIDVSGVRSTFGSRALRDNVAGDDAVVVARIKAAGACIIGKTTTSEFGCKPVGDSPLTGVTRNPWNLAKTPGGSSSGAASSVAAGITPFAVATDGGGSIRVPSSFTGAFGIKAQFGRVPLFPHSATPTLAHVGPIARTVRDAALLLSVMSGPHPGDPWSLPVDAPDFLAACDLPAKGMRVAWSPTLGYARPCGEVECIVSSAVKVFEDLGCRVSVEDVVMDDPIDLWMGEFYAGMAARFRPSLQAARDQIDPAVRELLDDALGKSATEYHTLIFKRYELREKLRRFFDGYDLLLTPTLPVAAFDTGLNAPPGWLDQRGPFGWVSYTYPFNLTGQPAASIPCGFTADGLPVGLQMVAGPGRETDIFRAAAAFEAARPWSDKRPALNV
ncbi:MAG: amidase [Gammaproteobacteria bacterium]|nr:amidase [Gammaproteobacteria bacterium]